MILAEFLAPLKGRKRADYCLALLFYAKRYEAKDSLTIKGIRERLISARMRGAKTANLSVSISSCIRLGYMGNEGKENGSNLYMITGTGEKYIRPLLSLPECSEEITNDVSSLQSLVASIGDANVRGYVEEAMKCLSVGALRAAVVFLWAGAVRIIQTKAIGKVSRNDLNTALRRHDPSVKDVAKIEDFGKVKEATLLEATVGIGLYDGNQKKHLKEALDLRNSCGHPSNYNPGVNKVRAFIEDVVNMVFR